MIWSILTDFIFTKKWFLQFNFLRNLSFILFLFAEILIMSSITVLMFLREILIFDHEWRLLFKDISSYIFDCFCAFLFYLLLHFPFFFFFLYFICPNLKSILLFLVISFPPLFLHFLFSRFQFIFLFLYLIVSLFQAVPWLLLCLLLFRFPAISSKLLHFRSVLCFTPLTIIVLDQIRIIY